MPFEFYLPTLEEMRATPDGLEMLRMIDDDGFRSAMITGCPGSGKTTVSIYRLVRLNGQSKKVHLVTYQNMLVLAIKHLANVQKVPPTRVSTFHKWYCPKTHTIFNTDAPPSAAEMKQQLDVSTIPHADMEELLIDEGQDLPLCVYQTLPQYFKRCFVGADNAQQVHPQHGARIEEIEAVLQDNFGPYRRFALARNFRNTYETYCFARQFIPKTNLIAWDPAILERLDRASRRGPKPVVVTYSDTAARNAHLRMVLENAEGNVAVLCPLGPRSERNPGISVDEMHEIVTRLGFEASKYHNDSTVPNVLKRYVVTTFKSAKGMEFSTVIVPRINFFKKIPAEWYVACTRARGNLIIYRDAANPQCDPIRTFDSATYESESAVGPAADAAIRPF